jgi:hypothetical protein
MAKITAAKCLELTKAVPLGIFTVDTLSRLEKVALVGKGRKPV